MNCFETHIVSLVNETLIGQKFLRDLELTLMITNEKKARAKKNASRSWRQVI